MIAYILLIGHFLADFFFQPVYLVEKKKHSIKFLLLHSAIYLITISILSFLFIEFHSAILIVLILSFIHFIIDFIRIKCDAKFDNHIFQFVSFITDQVIHIFTVIIVSYLFNLNEHVNYIYAKLQSYQVFEKTVLYIFLIVVLLEPTAVLIKKLFAFILKGKTDNIEDSENSENSKNSINAGKLIGELERIITSMLILCDQYNALGFVLTAKSIARFKKMEDQDFAEKYLVGTLTSLTISLLITIFIKSLL